MPTKIVSVNRFNQIEIESARRAADVSRTCDFTLTETDGHKCVIFRWDD